MRKLDIIFC